MKVLFLSHHCCIRVVKQSLALRQAGVEVIHLQHRIANPDSAFLVGNHHFYKHNVGLEFVLKDRFHDIDLIHVHNEPHILATIARKVRPDIPIVFDAHDLDTARTRREHEEEAEAIRSVDGIVTPSQGYNDHCRDWYRLDEDYPIITLYSYCNKAMIDSVQKRARVRIPGIVYEGGLGITTVQQKKLGMYSYRDWRDAATTMTKQGIPMHFYGADPDSVSNYIATGAVLHYTMPFTDMMCELSRYDWGLVGSTKPDHAFEWAMPNKLFEYMAAGVPPIVLNCQEAAQFVIEHGVGMVVKDLGEIPGIYDRHEKCRWNVSQKKYDFTMEKQMPMLLDFYDKVIERKRNGS